MKTCSSVMITGASRGIGLEFARQYVQDGWRVYATCRNPERALDLNRLAADHRDRLSVHPLDVTESRHIDAMSLVLGKTSLDLLINNAGMLGPAEQGFGHTDTDAWTYTLKVNAIAPLKLTEALADNLAKSQRPLAVVLSSRMGSIADNDSGGYYIYRSSKAAVNAVVKSAALDLAERGILVLAVHPGWVRTDMGGPQAEIDAVDSVSRLRTLFERVNARDTGRFFDISGEELPW